MRRGHGKNVIGIRIECAAWLEHDERADKAALELPHIVRVRVIDERACARRRHPGFKCGARRDELRTVVAEAAETGNPIVVTVLQLHAVPMHARGFAQQIRNINRGSLTARQKNRGTDGARLGARAAVLVYKVPE